MEWLFSIPPLIVLVLIGAYSFSNLIDKKWVGLIFLLKILIGLAQTWYYIDFLGWGDISTSIDLSRSFQEGGLFGWLRIGRSLFLSFGVHPLDIGLEINQRTAFFSWLLTPVFWLSSNNPFIGSIWCTMIFCFLVFWSLHLLNQFLSIPKALIWVLFLLPSSFFLASGIQKEALACGFLLMILSSILYSIRFGSKTYGGVAFLLVILLYYIRPFVVPPLLISLCVGLFIFGFGSRKHFRISIGLGLLVGVILGIVLIIHPVYSFGAVWDYLLGTHISLSSKTDYDFPVRLYDGMLMPEVLWNSIKAFWISLPGIWVGPLASPSYWVMLFEGMLLICLLFLFLKSMKMGGFNHRELSFLISMILFSSILAIGLGLSSPNFGTLLRYRLVFFLPLLASLSYFTFRPKSVN